MIVKKRKYKQLGIQLERCHWKNISLYTKHCIFTPEDYCDKTKFQGRFYIAELKSKEEKDLWIEDYFWKFSIFFYIHSPKKLYIDFIKIIEGKDQDKDFHDLFDIIIDKIKDIGKDTGFEEIIVDSKYFLYNPGNKNLKEFSANLLKSKGFTGVAGAYFKFNLKWWK